LQGEKKSKVGDLGGETPKKMAEKGEGPRKQWTGKKGTGGKGAGHVEKKYGPIGEDG